ncbi:MAG: hypothetical protein IJD01_08720 [Clostridia bacterium]|nr:hypothetical protein [Clostridia bacterium]
MKKTMWRMLAVFAALCMVLCCFASCGGGEPAEPADDSQGPQEVGSEEELTAVREELIKKAEIKGFCKSDEIEKMEFYENGVRTTSDEYVQVKDNKKMYYKGDMKRVVNYADGYIFNIPADWKPDYSMSTLRVRYENDDVTLIASREDNGIRYHGGAQQYMEALYLFVKNPDSQKNNGIKELESIDAYEIDDGEWTVQVYRVLLEGCKEGTKCYYTYADYFNKNMTSTYHFMFKCVDDRDFKDIIDSFHGIYDKGAPVDTRTYPQGNNENWAPETVEFYEAMCEQDHVDWGLFAYKLQTTGVKVTIPVLEKKLDFKFPIISEYIHYGSKETMNSKLKVGEFPLEFANKMKDEGRMMQITYQYTVNNNMDMTFQNPMLDIYRGTDEAIATITQFAEGAAEYGAPFYFRLNNEMNTDWTSYCAMANLLDPDIFVETWITLYDIFTETGANKYAMWIFNGFDNSYPPYNWCNYLCYFPDAKYVDMLGLTGYNFVTPEDTGTWETFEAKYDKIADAYNKNFSEWPWIISEFGCETSTNPEQSKAEWITGMFETLNNPEKYPQLKVAIWFNCSDYDQGGNVTNDLNLEKDPEVVQAFKEGLELTQP